MDLSLLTPAHIEVPDNAFARDAPLVAVLRGSYVGSLHRGSIAVVDPSGGQKLAIGNPAERVFLRSTAKPFQVMPAILGGAIERYGITSEELAVLCASHGGEPRHTEAVLSVLTKIGLDESALRCGTHPPLNEEAARRRSHAGIEPTPLCNNCSGAHAGMLLACRVHHWPYGHYGAPGHPLQRMIREVVATFAGLDISEVGIAIDNCAVPTFRLPLTTAALAFARLATGEGLDPRLAEAAELIVESMTAHPEMVGGEDRFDTDLMRATAGAIVAKGGAEGFHGIGLPTQRLGTAMKISDGNARAIPPVAMRIVEHLAAIDRHALSELARYREPEVHNLQGELVGRLTPVFSFGGQP